MLAALDLFSHLVDHPWPGCTIRLGSVHITLMSSGIATMIIVGVLLVVVLLLIARRRRRIPHGGHNLLEALVVFVRDMIAHPALGTRAYDHLPLLLTLFVFILGLNLMGVVPLESVSRAVAKKTGLDGYVVGGATTSIPTVCAALASIVLLSILVGGLRNAAHRCHEEKGWPRWVCGALSPFVWMVGLSPKIPGRAGVVLAAPVALLELIGALAKCFALMVRLFANMLSGHVLVAILLMLTLQLAHAALEQNVGMMGAVVVPILGSVLVNILEMLVAFLQAYIFTFLTAMYLGLYAGSGH